MDVAGEIREFLAGLPRDDENVPEGHVAIFRRTVTDAGGDDAAVYDWVRARGGTVKMAPAPRKPGIATGRQQFRAYYEIPAAALEFDALD
jgi:hypothetical protein